MRGLWLEEQRLLLRRDLPAPVCPEGEAVVAVRAAGICNTDLELTRGYYPYRGILGHEFVGVVEAGPAAWLGRRVVGDINAVCGDCSACRAGRRSHCVERTVLGIVGRDGALAERLTLPVENLHAVPEAVSDDEAVFTEPLAAALQITQQVAVGPADRAVVVGDGKLGLLAAQVLALTGCELAVLSRQEARLAQRLEALDLRAVSTAVDDGSCDVAVDCTGQPAGFEAARRALRPRGTLVLKSTYAGSLTMDAAALVVDEINLVGSRCGPFAPALRLLAEKRVRVAPMIAGRFVLDEAVAAMAHAEERGVLKVLLDVEAA
jgi:threonine dehydrogenase-like Zn-dependent dehydrogenase